MKSWKTSLVVIAAACSFALLSGCGTSPVVSGVTAEPVVALAGSPALDADSAEYALQGARGAGKAHGPRGGAPHAKPTDEQIAARKAKINALTDEQKAALKAKFNSFPRGPKPRGGAPHAKPTAEQLAAMKAKFGVLTDEQKAAFKSKRGVMHKPAAQ